MIVRICSHSFVASVLGPTSRILDVGANHGEFSSYCHREFKGQIVSVEPDPELAAALKARPEFRVVQAAVGGEMGELTLRRYANICSSVLAQPGGELLESVVVPAITFAALVKQAAFDGPIDLVKMDIEGAELAVLRAAPIEVLSRVLQLTIEFHDFLHPETAPAVDDVIRRLDAAGFTMIQMSRDRTDVLFVNRKHPTLDVARLQMVAQPIKYVRGAVRLLRRGIGLSDDGR